MSIVSTETLVPVNAKVDYILNSVFETYAKGQALTIDDICTDIDYELKSKGRRCDREEVAMVVNFLVYARKLKKSSKQVPIVVPGHGAFSRYTVVTYSKI